MWLNVWGLFLCDGYSINLLPYGLQFASPLPSHPLLLIPKIITFYILNYCLNNVSRQCCVQCAFQIAIYLCIRFYVLYASVFVSEF